MTKTETKKAAQDELMHGMQTALSTADFEGESALRQAMLVQFRRVEKFFGYKPGSWNEGI